MRDTFMVAAMRTHRKTHGILSYADFYAFPQSSAQSRSMENPNSSLNCSRAIRSAIHQIIALEGHAGLAGGWLEGTKHRHRTGLRTDHHRIPMKFIRNPVPRLQTQGAADHRRQGGLAFTGDGRVRHRICRFPLQRGGHQRPRSCDDDLANSVGSFVAARRTRSWTPDDVMLNLSVDFYRCIMIDA